MSNSALVTLSSSSSVSMFSSKSSPYSPVLAVTSSRLVDMVARLSIISCDANLPWRPNTADITSPTCWESLGMVLSCALTCFRASKVPIVPSASFLLIASASMPIPWRACLVVLDISRIRVEPILIASKPWSVKIPERVWETIAINWSACMPASWKVGAYCCSFWSISPLTSAPLAKPLFITSIACSPVRWKLAIKVSAVCSVSLKSLSITSAVACMLLRIARSSSPL